MNKRILFVDNDPLLLDFHALVREKAVAPWEIARAENSGQALVFLAAKKTDVVVADLRQFNTDGIGLMREVRRLYPRTARVSVAALNDQDKAVSHRESTNQFLCNVTTKELFATLLRTGKMDAVLTDETFKAFVGESDSPFSAASICLQIIRELNTEHPSLEAIADLAMHNATLTAKLLLAANSAAFARKLKVSNALEALQYIGLNLTRSIVLSAHIFRDFEHTDLKQFSAIELWDNALRYAEISQLILRLEKPDAPAAQDADPTLLLRNISKLMLAKSSLTHASKQPRRLAAPTVATPAADPKMLAAARTCEATNIFGLWGLATPMVEAVAFQLQPVENEPWIPTPQAIVSNNTFYSETEQNLDLPADINANNRLDSKHTDVQKLFAHTGKPFS